MIAVWGERNENTYTFLNKRSNWYSSYTALVATDKTKHIGTENSFWNMHEKLDTIQTIRSKRAHCDSRGQQTIDRYAKRTLQDSKYTALPGVLPHSAL